MPLMKSLRKFRLASVTGHIIHFTPDEHVMVPPEAVQEAMAAGCVPVDADEAAKFDDAGRAKVDFAGALRKSILYLVMKTLAKENDSRKFDAGGVPKSSVIEGVTGLTIGKAEIAAAWRDYLTASAAGDDVALHPSAVNVLRVLDAESPMELAELGKEFGVEDAEMRGMSMKELRRKLLSRLGGNAAG